jgi:hypothetical protein
MTIEVAGQPGPPEPGPAPDPAAFRTPPPSSRWAPGPPIGRDRPAPGTFLASPPSQRRDNTRRALALSPTDRASARPRARGLTHVRRDLSLDDLASLARDIRWGAPSPPSPPPSAPRRHSEQPRAARAATPRPAEPEPAARTVVVLRQPLPEPPGDRHPSPTAFPDNASPSPELLTPSASRSASSDGGDPPALEFTPERTPVAHSLSPTPPPQSAPAELGSPRRARTTCSLSWHHTAPPERP